MNITKYLIDVEKVGLVLALGALAVGLWHLREIRKVIRETRAQEEEAKTHTAALQKQRDEIKQISGDIKEIAGSISTRYVDTFPRNLPSIIDLIDRTTSSLCIVTDTPAYGHYSNPSAFEQYRLKLQVLASPDKNITINLLTYDDSKRNFYAKHQFGITEITQLRERDSYKAYFAYWKNKRQPKTMDDFYKLIHENNDKFRRELGQYDNIKICETDNQLPIFLWMRDENEAIFSFYNYGLSPREVSFRTNDQKLLAVLTEMANVAFENSRRYEPQPEVK